MADPRLHYRQPLQRTPFHARTSALARLNQWGNWAGYTTVLAFEDEAIEYSAIRNQASLYDISPMTKYRVAGPEAEAYLNRLTLRDVAKLKPGQVHYTAWCDGAGLLLDDGTLFRFAATEFMLCCQERHLPWLLDSAIGFDVSVRDMTEDLAGLSLQGPCSFAVLGAAGFAGAGALKPFQHMQVDFKGAALTISRTGFTGDLGYELWIEPAQALALWDHLFAAGRLHGLRPVGSNVLNLARLEAGFIIANVDFVPADQAVRSDRPRSPLEMGLGWMIDFEKGHFNGRRALLAEKAAGSRWCLAGLDVDGNVPAENALVYSRKTREVGYITGAAWSPVCKRNIALAMLERPHDTTSKDDLWVEIYAPRELQYHKLMVKARITARPFFNPSRRRATPPGLF